MERTFAAEIAPSPASGLVDAGEVDEETAEFDRAAPFEAPIPEKPEQFLGVTRQFAV
jgi:hypothetical protein